RLAALHRAFQLGVALQVHHVVANGGILVGRDQPHGPAAPLGEKDRAAVQPERLAQLTRDALEDVDEMERGGNFLENLDDGEQMLALALELGNARLECGGERHGIVSSPADAASSCRARARAIASRSEEHTSELQSLRHLVCRLLLEKKKNKTVVTTV